MLSDVLLHLIFALIAILGLELFGAALSVYFILESAEKMDQETSSPDLSHLESQIRDVRDVVNEIVKNLPKETQERIEDLKKRCLKCGKTIPSGFKACPNCGLEMSTETQQFPGGESF